MAVDEKGLGEPWPLSHTRVMVYITDGSVQIFTINHRIILIH